ncbi:MAG: phenol 2-monooxygenase [Acidobacteria bacterium]|nr:MAG: phenol 2-monooxygenase [Acidobacteriota bacterium]
MPVFHDGLDETAPPPGPVVETDVVVVGSGPAGASAALFLSTLGIDNIMITKYRWTADTPRAHITNQRTMEIFRDVGIEQQVLAEASPHDIMGDTVFCTALAGEELGRILSWGTHPAREADYVLASPSLNCDIPQTHLEPILVKNATVRGTQTRFSTEYLSHSEDADGVTVRVLDRLDGREFDIRARYLIGADGARSTIANALRLPFEGRMDIAGSMNITFRADLTDLVAHRPSVLYWVVQPGSDVGGIGAGLVRMVRPWNEWLAVWGYDIELPAPEMNDDRAREIVRTMIGRDDIDVEITGYSLWGNNEMYATHMQTRRVFIAGDAAHRHPPSNGLGSNTSIQDSYNLAWKIAAVLEGRAGPGLLETYSVERVPVAEQIVKRANKSSREFVGIFEALGTTRATTVEHMQAELAELRADTPEGAAKRQALAAAMELKNYEFNALGVELGQNYAGSPAVVEDGSAPPVPTRDPELHYEPHTYPGVRLPHCWVGDSTSRMSTHDLAQYTQFTLLTGKTGRAWAGAAAKVSEELGVDVVPIVIGAGELVQDLYFDWGRLREVAEDGAVLVRPDTHIGWRAHRMTDDPVSALRDAMLRILHRQA